jgi:hypothetical protein
MQVLIDYLNCTPPHHTESNNVAIAKTTTTTQNMNYNIYFMRKE